MSDSGSRADDYKARQRRDWDRVAAGWEKWWSVLELGAEHVSHRLLDLAGVGAGQRVLDVATGIGEPALSAARRVGPGGRVLGIDQADGMLAIARRRARQAGLDNVAFRAGDGTALPRDEAGFDCVLCRWGLMFFPDLAGALAGMRARLRSGGRMAAAVWSTPERVPSISLAMQVVQRELQLPPPPPDLPGPFALADTAALQRAFTQAGFGEIQVESVPVIFALPSAAAYTEFTRDIAAPIIALVGEQPAARQDEIWAAVTTAAQRHTSADGGFRVTNEAICIAGRA